MGAGVTDCRDRQRDGEYNKRCMPEAIIHLHPESLSWSGNSSIPDMVVKSCASIQMALIMPSH
jgi:hypothetical protein